MPLIEEAATWFLRMRSPDCCNEEKQAFEKWLASSGEHRSEYERLGALWKNLDGLDDYTSIPRRKRQRRAAVATLSLVLALSVGYLGLGTEQTYTTAIGEHRRIELADGSIADLNTGSEMLVHISLWARRVELARGEAMFDVAHEMFRPFEVRAAGTVLRDIGTRFNVQLEEDAVAVEVLEGIVEVRSPADGGPVSARIAAGKQVISDANGLSGLANLDTESAAAWISGRWIFRDTSLEEVVRELNRYHPQQTRLAGPEIGMLRVDGVFNTSDRPGLLKALESLHPLRVEESGGISILSWKQGKS